MIDKKEENCDTVIPLPSLSWKKKHALCHITIALKWQRRKVKAKALKWPIPRQPFATIAAPEPLLSTAKAQMSTRNFAHQFVQYKRFKCLI